MAKHLLTDRAVRNAKPQSKPYRIFDGDGLALLVSPTGVKSWQLRFRLDGKDDTDSLGKADRVTLAQARAKADETRALVARGEHPREFRQTAQQQRAARASTFGKFKAQWIQREARRMQWTADYREEVTASLDNHLADLDPLPISKITAAIAVPLLLKVERSAPHMVEKVRRRLRAILDDAVEQGIIPINPLPAVRRRKKLERKHYPAVTKLPEIGGILRAARAADPCKGVARAHLLLAFAAQRVSETVAAKWSEFALDGVTVPVGEGQLTKHDRAAGNWSIPRERMKRKDEARGPHVIPLPPTLLAALREWRDADGADAIYVCPAPRDPATHVTPEACEKFYRRALGLAGKHSPHSWRSSFSTVCREAGKDGDAVEAQLDHVVGNPVAAAYDRAKRLQRRRELVRWYERQLLAARDGAEVVPMRKV